MRHQYRAYGGWSFAQEDYYAENITQELGNPIVQLMMDIIDPYGKSATNGFDQNLTLPLQTSSYSLRQCISTVAIKSIISLYISRRIVID